MMYYVISWIGIIILAVCAYKYVQEVKYKAYKEGFDDGWEERSALSVSARVQIMDFMNEERG